MEHSSTSVAAIGSIKAVGINQMKQREKEREKQKLINLDNQPFSYLVKATSECYLKALECYVKVTLGI